MTNGSLGAYARLRVENRGKITAEDVELLVWDTEGGPDDRQGLVSDIPLFVSLSRPATSRVNVAPGAARHIDFVHVEQGRPKNVFMDVCPEPADRRNFLPPGVYRAEVIVTARNAKALRYSVPFEWDGGFDVGAEWDSLRVGPISKL